MINFSTNHDTNKYYNIPYKMEIISNIFVFSKSSSMYTALALVNCIKVNSTPIYKKSNKNEFITERRF